MRSSLTHGGAPVPEQHLPEAGGMALCRDDLWFFAAMVTAGAAMTCAYVLLHG